MNDPTKLLMLPFPSVLFVSRMPVDDIGSFYYLGRESLVEPLTQRIANLPSQNTLHVLGNIGSGKSHLIAASVLKLRCQFGRRVIYIADCKESSSSMFEHRILQSVHLAFSEVADFNTSLYDATDKQAIRDYITQFLLQKKKSEVPSIVFILDGYNFFELSTLGKLPSATQLKVQSHVDFILPLARMVGSLVLAQNPSCFGGSRPDNVFNVYGGLTDTEWNGWKNYPPYSVLANVPLSLSTSAPASPSNNPTDASVPLSSEGTTTSNEAALQPALSIHAGSDTTMANDELKRISGYIPIILRKLASYGNEDVSMEERLVYFILT
jgi:hypothetical protein